MPHRSGQRGTGRTGFVSSLALAAGAVLIAGHIAAAQDQTPPPYSAERHFQFACATCHGTEGRGDGPIADQLNTPPPDLTKISRRNGGVFPSKKVYETIKGLAMPTAHGTREMPIWGAVLLFEELGTSVSREDAAKAARNTQKRLEELVEYLESIQE